MKVYRRRCSHDSENVYFRIQFDGASHSPAPFVEGGKMDPDNEIKVAMMITGTGIELGDQVGCWATCHADNTYMPFDPGADAIAAALPGRQPGPATAPLMVNASGFSCPDRMRKPAVTCRGPQESHHRLRAHRRNPFPVNRTAFQGWQCPAPWGGPSTVA